MKISDWLHQTMVTLQKAGVDSPRRDALVLLEDTLTKDRAWVLAHPEYEIKRTELEKVDKLINRRIEREPLAYIRGKAWFYGRFFQVNPDVLIPRPETECFIELLKGVSPKTIVEIGTGSGALAITAKLEFLSSKVIATDIDKKAQVLARQNTKLHNVDIKFLCGSLLEPLQNLDLNTYMLIANLPYVPTNLITSPEIEHEPKLALFSGKDGLNHYRKFWHQVAELEFKPKYILTESLENQHKAVQNLAQESGYRLLKTEVLVQLYTNMS